MGSPQSGVSPGAEDDMPSLEDLSEDSDSVGILQNEFGSDFEDVEVDMVFSGNVILNDNMVYGDVNVQLLVTSVELYRSEDAFADFDVFHIESGT